MDDDLLSRGLQHAEHGHGAAEELESAVIGGNMLVMAGAGAEEVAQLCIDPAAADHVFDAEAAILVKGPVAYAARLRLAQIIATGKAAGRGAALVA